MFRTSNGIRVGNMLSNLWNYAWAEEEEMEFNSHQLRPLKVMQQKTIAA